MMNPNGGNLGNGTNISNLLTAATYEQRAEHLHHHHHSFQLGNVPLEPLGQSQEETVAAYGDVSSFVNVPLDGNVSDGVPVDPNTGLPLVPIDAATVSQVLNETADIEEKPKRKRKKSTKDDTQKEKRPCMADGCERMISSRRLCSAHQKQKERNGGQIALKDKSEQLTPSKAGRPITPFSKQANPHSKLQNFDEKINEIAGGMDEGNHMISEYLNSSFYQNRFPKQEDSEVYECIGKNITNFLDQLPNSSPFRKPLIKAMGKDIAVGKLEKVISFKKSTITKAFKLPDDDNLLLSIRYKSDAPKRHSHHHNNNNNNQENVNESLTTTMDFPETLVHDSQVLDQEQVEQALTSLQ